MSAPSIPPDNSLQVEQAQEAAAQRAKADADTKAQKDAADLAALRTSSAASGGTAARNYFQEQGLDPNKYGSDIDQHIQSILSGISKTDPNPGSSFLTAPQDIYSGLTKSSQNKNLQAANSIFSPEYGASKATNSLVDPIISGIEATQRGSADDIIKNMLKRGVITPSGQTAAEGELDRQAPGVFSQLRDIGQGTITGEQGALDTIANKARQTAQTTSLGQNFDPNTYGAQADQQFNDFVNNLGNTVKGKVTGNLFNTTGLAAIAGAGQGAGNTVFDPKAAAGVIGGGPSDTTDPNAPSKNTGISNTSTSVF